MTTWTKKQLFLHEEAGRRLTKIIHEGFSFLRDHRSSSEYEVQQFLYEKLRDYDLVKKDSHPLIVAFGAHSAIPHHRPEKKSVRILKKGDMIKIDIWARLKNEKAPYADITWMGSCGVPTEQKKKVFMEVIRARNAGIQYLKKELRKGEIPIGSAVHNATYAPLLTTGYQYRKELKHSTGHCLGLTSPHGRGTNISMRDRLPLKKNVGYTIEPGVYLDGKFGVRSEIDFYIDESYNIHITTPMQKELIIV